MHAKALRFFIRFLLWVINYELNCLCIILSKHSVIGRSFSGILLEAARRLHGEPARSLWRPDHLHPEERARGRLRRRQCLAAYRA